MRTRKSFLKDLCAGTIATFFFPSIIKAFNQDGPLKSPSNVKAEAGSGSHFIVTWQADPDNKQKFRIERRMDNEQWENAGVAGTDMTRYLSAGCFANTSYDHRVVAFNDTSEAISEIVSGTTPDKLPDRRGGIIETSSARQGEGTFLKLKNGNLELYYSDMETVSDLAEAQVSKVVSSDGGKTWGERQVVFKEKGFALFLPGAVRLPNGNIGITYAHRIPGQWYSKRVFRYSTDENNI